MGVEIEMEKKINQILVRLLFKYISFNNNSGNIGKRCKNRILV